MVKVFKPGLTWIFKFQALRQIAKRTILSMQAALKICSRETKAVSGIEVAFIGVNL